MPSHLGDAGDSVRTGGRGFLSLSLFLSVRVCASAGVTPESSLPRFPTTPVLSAESFASIIVPSRTYWEGRGREEERRRGEGGSCRSQ